MFDVCSAHESTPHTDDDVQILEKIFVLDTNVLLHDPTAITAFAEHQVVIPMTVLEELDNIKDRHDKVVSKEARIAINTIEKLLSGASSEKIQQGVKIQTINNNHGTLAIYPDQKIDHDAKPTKHFLNATTHQQNDNRIINSALSLQDEFTSKRVYLVTKDINMRLKARGSGLDYVEDYRRDRVLDDIDLLTKGYHRFSGNFWDSVPESEITVSSAHGNSYYTVNSSLIPHAHINLLVLDEGDFAAQVIAIDDKHMVLRDLKGSLSLNHEYWGLKPRNAEQAMALYQLENDDLDINVITGPAGSGKTLLSLAYGLHAVLEQKRYDKIIIARSTPPIAEDIGFLPGTEEEKMAPWLAAFEDNLEVLHGTDECATGSISYIKEKANIQFKSLNFMRGRSFNNAYIIIDEAQGLTQFQLKSIITRVGVNSKIVVLGNLAQIDNKYITPLTSGLTYVVDRCKDFKHAGVMHVNGIERSRLAAFAEENL